MDMLIIISTLIMSIAFLLAKNEGIKKVTSEYIIKAALILDVLEDWTDIIIWYFNISMIFFKWIQFDEMFN